MNDTHFRTYIKRRTDLVAKLENIKNRDRAWLYEDDIKRLRKEIESLDRDHLERSTTEQEELNK